MGFIVVSLHRDTLLPWLRIHSWVEPIGKLGKYFTHFPKLKMAACYCLVIFISALSPGFLTPGLSLRADFKDSPYPQAVSAA